MKKHSFSFFISALIIISLVCTIPPASAFQKGKGPISKKEPQRTGAAARTGRGVEVLSGDPYLGAVVIDAATGSVLFEDNADAQGYPASLVKLMNFLLILEAVDAGRITLQDRITVSAEAAKMGGSQVYLKEREIFTVDDLLYALIVHSANDAAAALALHYGGTREAFVDMMNRRARALGMADTVFHSVHGLPPGKGQMPDVSTPRDITKLCRELLKHPEALKYTSTRVRLFRTDAPEPFILKNHNHLVGSFEGCDGLKTGFFRAAGFSIAATAASNEGRVITVIMGSAYSKVRDAKARELLSAGMTQIASHLPPPPSDAPESAASMSGWGRSDTNLFMPLTEDRHYLLILALLSSVYVMRRRKK